MCLHVCPAVHVSTKKLLISHERECMLIGLTSRDLQAVD